MKNQKIMMKHINAWATTTRSMLYTFTCPIELYVDTNWDWLSLKLIILEDVGFHFVKIEQDIHIKLLFNDIPLI